MVDLLIQWDAKEKALRKEKEEAERKLADEVVRKKEEFLNGNAQHSVS